MSYAKLTAIEVSVLEALGEREPFEGFANIELPGVCPELVAVTVCRLMHKRMIEATPDGVPGAVTAAGREWLRACGPMRLSN
jgi:hypothetical protein